MSVRKIEVIEKSLIENPKTWLVTGAAGFVGSNLVNHLIDLGQNVIGLDNYITGLKSNVERLESKAKTKGLSFQFQLVDIKSLECLDSLFKAHKFDFVLHQAALGSVPRSIDTPMASHENNVNGFLNVLETCRKYKTSKLVYASSSSVYGDSPRLPKVEQETGNLLSPYAATKFIDEIYAGVYGKVYGLSSVGLRYFNVFGPHQNPEGAYAAVIPRWYDKCLSGNSPEIFGDGETSRDFCYIENVIQANLLAACSSLDAKHEVYNIAAEKRITLNELLSTIQETLALESNNYSKVEPIYSDFRKGDVRHSLADVSKAKKDLGYDPEFNVNQGLSQLSKWYVHEFGKASLTHHFL